MSGKCQAQHKAPSHLLPKPSWEQCSPCWGMTPQPLHTKTLTTSPGPAAQRESLFTNCPTEGSPKGMPPPWEQPAPTGWSTWGFQGLVVASVGGSRPLCTASLSNFSLCPFLPPSLSILSRWKTTFQESACPQISASLSLFPRNATYDRWL